MCFGSSYVLNTVGVSMLVGWFLFKLINASKCPLTIMYFKDI